MGHGGLQLGSGSTRILQVAVVQVSLKGAGHVWSGALESRIVTGAPRKPNCGRCANVDHLSEEASREVGNVA